MTNKFFTILVMSCILLSAQDNGLMWQEITVSKHVDGTLLLPDGVKNPALAIIIPGSGPTDRNGNQDFLKSDALKKLAEGLGKNGIASFRYDKRVVKQIRQGNYSENVVFDDFIADAVDVLNFFSGKGTFSNIYILGHSQGSLVGMVAAQEGADGFVSLAGAGQTIDEVLLYQINKTAPQFTEDAKRILGVLEEGQTTEDFPQALTSIFRIDVQPFIASWMQYNPQSEIQKLEIPILIVNGTKDLQVSIDEANLLKQANPNAELLIIENMNHILTNIEGGDLDNSKSYNEPKREISPELISALSDFIR